MRARYVNPQIVWFKLGQPFSTLEMTMFRSYLPLILLGAAACDPSDKVAPATDSDGSDDTATVPCGVTYYLDSVGGGYGDPSVSTCDEVAPIG